MKETKMQILGYTLGTSVAMVLLSSYIYVIIYNYLYKKYRKKLEDKKIISNLEFE